MRLTVNPKDPEYIPELVVYAGELDVYVNGKPYDPHFGTIAVIDEEGASLQTYTATGLLLSGHDQVELKRFGNALTKGERAAITLLQSVYWAHKQESLEEVEAMHPPDAWAPGDTEGCKRAFFDLLLAINDNLARFGHNPNA